MQKFARPPAAARAATKQAPLVDRLVCWDLDETLGQFYGIYARMNGYGYSGDEGLKPGIRNALRELAGLGFTHVVTTAAGKREANAALEESGLIGYFSGIFHDTLILNEMRKDYRTVADAFGMAPEEFRRKAIVVGDILPLDMPDGGVFIHEPDSPFYSATIVKTLILLLSERGEGDFRAGFEAVHGQAPGLTGTAQKDLRVIMPAEGFIASLYYEGGTAIARIAIADERFKAALEPF